MFGRKKIVIGKNYLYDVMNETDMADAATLVTVIRKKKKNKYMVMAVNNFKVFETDACFLERLLRLSKRYLASTGSKRRPA